MTLQLLHSEFPYTVYEENFVFFFISVDVYTLYTKEFRYGRKKPLCRSPATKDVLYSKREQT
jgi:hypothetical protein